MTASSDEARGMPQIAHALKCSESTARRMIRKGLVPVRKAGTGGLTSMVVADRKALEALMKKR